MQTMQTNDYVYYAGGRYILMDVEKGKLLVCGACMDDDIKQRWCAIRDTRKLDESSQHRGYRVDYLICDDTLYLVDPPASHAADTLPVPEAVELDPPSSTGTMEKVPYTGYLLIVFYDEKAHPLTTYVADQIGSILHADDAYELRFESGKLVESYDYSDALAEYAQKRDDLEVGEKEKTVQEIINSRLKGDYAPDTYKWRFSKNEIGDKGDSCCYCRSHKIVLQ